MLIHNLDGEVLMLERAEPGGFWQSVTGSLEAGETPDQAARREILEETGWDLVPLACFWSHRFPIRPPWSARYAPGVEENREYVFRLVLRGRARPRLNPAEHVNCAWIPAAEAVDRAFSWTNQAVIRRYLSLA